MLPDDAALQSVSDGPDGVLAGLPNGGLHVSMSTISPSASAGLAARHADRDQHYLAATVFGRPDRAAEAKLWLVVAGPSESVTRATPLFEAVSQGQFRVGDMPESANVVKLAGNFLISSMLEALGETYALARKAGVSPTELLNVLNTAVFNSPAYESYGQQVAERRFTPGFKLRLALKDLRLLLETADARQTPMPLASLIHDQLLSGVARGMGDMDWSALTQVIADNAGD
jgi:3-hydroxyisobutyrate dehydrogenase-like beta-hydroxyacid dehydrogenase